MSASVVLYLKSRASAVPLEDSSDLVPLSEKEEHRLQEQHAWYRNAVQQGKARVADIQFKGGCLWMTILATSGAAGLNLSISKRICVSLVAVAFPWCLSAYHLAWTNFHEDLGKKLDTLFEEGKVGCGWQEVRYFKCVDAVSFDSRKRAFINALLSSVANWLIFAPQLVITIAFHLF